MKFGISTASLFGRYNTEDALEFLNKNGCETAEVFLESFCEYNAEFGKTLKARKGGVDVHSVHVLTTQFEPQLYSLNERAKQDSFCILEGAMAAAREIGAGYYTFHGGARFKKTPLNIDFDRIGAVTNDIIAVAGRYGVQLAHENVHWGYYNYIGFFKELKKRAPALKGTLDVKQARQSGIDCAEFIDEMGQDIVTVHLSDIDGCGKMCLPGRGITDYKELFSRLGGAGFDGAVLLEVYKNDFENVSELFRSLDFVKTMAEKYV